MFLDNVTLIVYLVCMVVVILFAIVFIAISALYFSAKKKLYLAKIEDPNVQKDVDKDYETILKKKREDETPVAYFRRKQKQNDVWGKVWNVVLIVVYLAVIGFVSYQAVVKVQGKQTFINHEASLVIQTDSMATVDKTNEADLKAHGVWDEKNRIHEYAYITISNDPNVMANIQPYDVVAFRMRSILRDAGDDSQMTVVHRVIRIKTGSDGKRLFTFRGDANPGSMTDETDVTEDRLVGVYSSSLYHGSYNLGWGYFVVYIQSTVGIITLVVAFLLLVIYSVTFDRLANAYDSRYQALLQQKFEGIKALPEPESAALAAPKTVIVPAAPDIQPVRTVSLLPEFHDGLCLHAIDAYANVSFQERESVYGMPEYVAIGKFHAGRCAFLWVDKDQKTFVPYSKDFDYGYTFEGEAQSLFQVQNALACVAKDDEDRTYVYIKEDSNLIFLGKEDEDYEIDVRLFDNALGNPNNRWLVIYARKALKD